MYACSQKIAADFTSANGKRNILIPAFQSVCTTVKTKPEKSVVKVVM